MLHTPTKRRRLRNTLILVLASVVAVIVARVAEVSLANPAEWTGWMVLISVVILLVYAVRKRLSTLPLGRVAHWLQVHIYLGIFCLFVFLLHTGWQLPNGWFESLLAISFIGTIVTGLLGIYWSRTLPTQLTRLGDEVIYERIGGFVGRVRADVEAEILSAVEASGSRALADFYQRSGHSYFAAPRFQWQRLYRNMYQSQKIHQALEMARRFMTPEELPFADKLALLIDQKNRLDAHYTWQSTLKHWLFVHLAFSLAMIPLVTLHVILAYSFALA